MTEVIKFLLLPSKECFFKKVRYSVRQILILFQELNNKAFSGMVRIPPSPLESFYIFSIN